MKKHMEDEVAKSIHAKQSSIHRLLTIVEDTKKDIIDEQYSLEKSIEEFVSTTESKIACTTKKIADDKKAAEEAAAKKEAEEKAAKVNKWKEENSDMLDVAMTEKEDEIKSLKDEMANMKKMMAQMMAMQKANMSK